MITDPTSKNSSLVNCASGSICANKTLIEELNVEIENLKLQAKTDALTGLYNYRFFADALPREMERAQRSLQPMSLMMIDIDYFKKLNDQWGHEVGNHALVHISNLILQIIRKLDIACRFGGEEFVVILPNTDLRQSIYVADRIREAIETSVLQIDQARSVHITASLGVDEYRANHSDSMEGFIERVDAWLYQAKHSGRNRVMHPELIQSFVKSNVTVDEKDALFNTFSNESD